jgi:prepilin-type N-terminal cleavage/methylation domain-containing protein
MSNKNKDKGQGGFTLIEVMIALAIFSVFIAVYVTSQGYNVADSAQFKQELKLKQLTELKVNELVINPPDLTESLTLTPQTSDFEDWPNYSYAVTYKKFLIPDFNKIKGGDPEQNREDATQQRQVEKRIYETVKENMELLLWQIEVKVTDKTTQESYVATTWIYNHKAQVEFGSFQ